MFADSIKILLILLLIGMSISWTVSYVQMFRWNHGNTVALKKGEPLPKLDFKGIIKCKKYSLLSDGILITHQDTDYMGALETDTELLFKNATIYLSEIENRYLTAEVRRKVYRGCYKLPLVKTENKKVLLKDGQIIYIEDIKIECFLVTGHTWGHLCYLIDDKYLFTGDTIWFGPDGGYSFLDALAEDNDLAKKSLAEFEQKLRMHFVRLLKKCFKIS